MRAAFAVVTLGLGCAAVASSAQRVLRGGRILPKFSVGTLNFHVVRLENKNGGSDFDFSNKANCPSPFAVMKGVPHSLRESMQRAFLQGEWCCVATKAAGPGVRGCPRALGDTAVCGCSTDPVSHGAASWDCITEPAPSRSGDARSGTLPCRRQKGE